MLGLGETGEEVRQSVLKIIIEKSVNTPSAKMSMQLNYVSLMFRKWA